MINLIENYKSVLLLRAKRQDGMREKGEQGRSEEKPRRNNECDICKSERKKNEGEIYELEKNNKKEWTRQNEEKRINEKELMPYMRTRNN